MDDVTFEEQYGFTKEAAIAHFGLEEGETLAHFGVKGMTWGKRKARGSRPASSGRPRMGNRSVNPGATKSGDGKSEKAPMSRKKKIAIGVGIGVGAAALTVGGIYAARALNKSGGINLSDIKSRSTFAVNASKSFMNDSATKAKNQATSVSMLAEAAARSGSNKARRAATRAGDIARNPRTSAGLAGLAVRDAAAPAVNRAGQLGRYGQAVGGRAVRNAAAGAAGAARSAGRNAASLAGDASDAARGAADLARRGAGTAVRNGAGNVARGAASAARGARNAAGAAAKEARTAGDIARLAVQNPGVVGNAARGVAGNAARGVAGGARVSASNVRKATSSLAKEGRAAASLGAMITRNPGIAAQLAAAPTMAKAKNIISGLDIGAVSPKALATLLRDLR